MKFKLFGSDSDGKLSVSAGGVFQKVWRDNTVETATVLNVGAGPNGIPHVRYRVRFGRDSNIFDESPRILALSHFAERYRKAATS